MSKTKTVHYSEIFDQKTAEGAYEYMKNNIEWTDGIYSRKHKSISRQAYSFENKENDVDDYILQLVKIGLSKINDTNDYIVLGVYVNYYKNQDDWCPMHAHKGTVQMILSFGATRPLKVGTKEYNLKSGDGIVFGSSSHGFDKDPNLKEGRISIAIFLGKIDLSELKI